MGLLDTTTEQSYYEGQDFGNYQFISLDEVVSQFLSIYVGQDKVIPKIKRGDVQFHAMRALRELSFDTFKSYKSQQIELPPSLQMILPHDYVNYTKISWSDSSGIKHPLYPTTNTNNPFHIRQDDDKSYLFSSDENKVENGDFSSDIFHQGNWLKGGPTYNKAWSQLESNGKKPKYLKDKIRKYGGALSMEFLPFWHTGTASNPGLVGSRSYGIWQKIDVRNIRYIDFKATGKSADQATSSTTGDMADYGVVRVGLTSIDPATGLKQDGSVGWARPDGTAIGAGYGNPFNTNHPSPNYLTSSYDIDYLQWNDGTESEKSKLDIYVEEYDFIYLYIQSFVPFKAASITAPTGVGTTSMSPSSASWTTYSVNTVDDISITSAEPAHRLTHKNLSKNSDTWNNYKSRTPSENNNDDYEDDTYWPHDGKRYGLEPSHAQANGSFFIDQRLGKIHFSSNLSGKEVILDYISDSLGTDEEMVVHKFAEDAMYKHILCDVMMSRANIGRNQIMYYKKDKFAAVRKAKLRLSNIKIEELTQILRGKSKWIKH